MASQIEQQIYNLLGENIWIMTIVNIICKNTPYEYESPAKKFIVVVAEIICQDTTLRKLISIEENHLKDQLPPIIIRKLAVIIRQNAQWLYPLLIFESKKHSQRKIKNHSKTSAKTGKRHSNTARILHSTRYENRSDEQE